jgi:hypothetical protein
MGQGEFVFAPAKACIDAIRAAIAQPSPRAAATRGSFRRAKGSGAPKIALLALAALAVTLVLGVSLASAIAPVVTIEDAANPSYTTAEVKGTVDPQGQSTYYRIQYTTDAKYQENIANGVGPWEEAGEGPQGPAETVVETPEGTLTGLAPGTLYHLRIWAENPDGPSEAVASDFETLPVPAPTVTIDTPTLITGHSAHFSGHINPGGTDPAFEVTEWQFRCTPECPGLATQTLPAGNSSVEVEADATGLVPGTNYEVSLFAKNIANEATAGPEAFPTPTIAPEIQGASADALNTEATLNGVINPGGLATEYHFEFGTTASYGQSTPTKTLPVGGLPLTVHAPISGLTAGTPYHYRLVASNSIDTSDSGDKVFTTQIPPTTPGNCPNEAVRIQQQSTYLPDCRAYEMVSPVDKNGTDVQNVLKFGHDGEGAAWLSLGAYADGNGANAEVPYVAARGVDGSWSTTSFFPEQPAGEYRPGLLGLFGGYAFPDDFSSMLEVSGGPLDLLDQDEKFFGAFWKGYSDIYRVGPDRKAVWISRNTEGPTPNEFADAPLRGMSSDGSTIFFESAEALAAGAPAADLECANSSVPQTCNLYRWQSGQVIYVGYDQENQPLAGGSGLGSSLTGAGPGSGSAGDLPDSNAVSADGSSFVYGGRVNSGDPEQVYLRRSDGSIVRISSSHRSDNAGDPSSGATFVATTGGLSAVFIRSTDRLTDDAPVGGGDYRYDVASEVLSFSNIDEAQSAPATVSGFVRASDDGRYVYFVAAQAMAPGATAGRPNLYVKSPTGVHFIAKLNPGELKAVLRLRGGDAGAPEYTTTALSGDGSRLVFETTLCGSEGCLQVYLYDADSKTLQCVSCNPARPISSGDARITSASEFNGVTTPQAISSSGERVTFTSTESLLPQDQNVVADVYQWDDGKLSLISSGKSGYRSDFAGASDDGRDIFFTTRSSLVAADDDSGLVDIYDARIDGGRLEVDAGRPCAGEGCRTPLSTQPPAAGIASLATGSGNLKPKKASCPKGKVRKGHRCVKKHAKSHKRANNNRRAGR